MKVAILGCSDAGLALVADLVHAGHSVTLQCDGSEKGQALMAAGRFTCLSEAANLGGGLGLHEISDFVRVTSAAEAVAGAELVYLVSSPHDHEAILDTCAAAFDPEALLVLPQSGVGGALLAAAVLRRHGRGSVPVAQISAPYTIRPTTEATIRINKKKDRIPMGVHPAARTDEVLERLAPLFPQYYAVANSLAAGLTRVGMALHPIPMIMGAVKIEQLGRYQYNAYDITPGVARVIEAADRERQALLLAMGLEAPSFVELLNRSFGATGSNFHEAVHDVATYKNAYSPDRLDHRYITDDVPTQVVPITELSAALGLKTPLFDAVIAMSDAILGTDMRRTGWNLERLGLSGMNAAAILDYLQSGRTGQSA